jgi:hypothetical protein
MAQKYGCEMAKVLLKVHYGKAKCRVGEEKMFCKILI